MGALGRFSRLTAGAILALCLALPAHANANAIPPDAAAEFLQAIDAEHRDDWQGASRLYTAVWTQTGNETALRKAFLFALGSGDIPTALRLADKIPERLPEHTVSAALQAAAAIRDGDLGQARKAIDSLPQQGISVPLGAMLDAWLNAVPHADHKAIPAALDRAADFGVLQTLHATLIADYTGDRAKADKGYATLADSRDSARLAVFARDYYRRTGQIALADGIAADLPHTTDGLVLASIEANKTPTPKPTLASGTAEAYYDVAEVLLDAEHPDIALFYARIAAYLDPTSADMRFLLGEIEQAQGRYAAAADDFANAPANSAFTGLGKLDAALNYERAGNAAKGIAVVQSLVAQEPVAIEPKSILANMLSRKGRYGEAIMLYDQCLSAIASTDPRRGAILLNRGIAYDHQGKNGLAEADLIKTVALTPDQPLALNYLGYFWTSRGEHLDEARALLERAYALQPDDPAIADSLGWVQYRQGDYKLAAETLEAAVVGAPADSTLNLHLGDAYWRTGRLTEARYQWQRALRDASQEDRAGLHQRLISGLPPVASPPTPAVTETHASLEMAQ